MSNATKEREDFVGFKIVSQSNNLNSLIFDKEKEKFIQLTKKNIYILINRHRNF